MNETISDCNLDLVIEMEEMGIGAKEIIQYARGILAEEEIRALVQGLQNLIPEPLTVDSL